ncbi:MAG TPA: CHAT domain-containing tetratricopeptide repeat protein [Parafilimonas sp.]|nr:CHAT domain-containing tetratricopeptide repeat protein [Parafilimonas sp.]
MMNRVCIWLLFAFLSVQNAKSDAQQVKTPSPGDSLTSLLDYFYTNTNDTAFQQALRKSKTMYAAGVVTDSLARQLIYTEDLLLHLIKDSAFLNRHPFNEAMVLNLANSIVNLSRQPGSSENNICYAAALNNLGNMYRQKMKLEAIDIEKAFDLFKKALAISERIPGKANLEYAESLFCMGELYSGKGEYKKALSMMLRSMAIRKSTAGEYNADYADNLYSLAAFCREQKKYDTSLFLYGEEMKIREKISGGKNSNYALHLYLAGEMMGYLWQYRKAFSYYNQAKALTEEITGTENILYAFCLEGLAGYYYTIAEYKNAIPLYLQSLEIKEKLYGKEDVDIALTLHNIATTYIKMGKYEQAIPCFQRLLSNNKNSPLVLPINYAYELSWFAGLYQGIGNYKKALSLYTEALNMPGYKEQGLRYAATLNSMAALYAALNENEKALSYLERARSIIKNMAGERSPDYANALYNLSAFYEKLNRYNTAMEFCRESLLIRKKIYGASHPQYASSLCLLGKIYTDMDKTDAARLCFARALEIQKKALGDEHPDYIKALNNLALLQVAERNNKEASFTMVKANRLELRYIARIYTSLSEQEKIELENDQYCQFSYLPSLIYKNNIAEPELLQQLYRNELALKGMVLNDQQRLLNSIRKSGDTFAIDLYNEWRINKAALGKQLLLPKEERSPGFDSLEKVTNRLEQNLSLASAAFRRQQQAITTKNISEKLFPGQAAIEFIKFRVYNRRWTDSVMYAALIILAGDSIPAFVPLFEEKQLMNVLSKPGKNENAINRLYSQAFSNSNEYSGNALYNLTWKPLEKYLSKVHTIYYAPAGLLHRIAFGALPADTAHFLADRYALNQMLSTRSVALQETAIPEKPAAINVWGDINYNLKKGDTGNHLYATVQRGPNEDWYENTDDADSYDTAALQSFKWPSLDGARVEMDSIERIFINAGINVTATADSVATEEMFKKLDGNSPQLLHIATHGFFWASNNKLHNSFAFQQDAMFRSGLVLAGANEIWTSGKPAAGEDDGILTSYEIAQLDLNNTDLVVLSACESALGDLEGNEGVIGLQRAFKIAGVKQMILSLWKVPDKETVELMTVFYKHLIEGQSPAESLRAAQLKMKETYYAPYYWAAFVLIE